MGENVLIFRNKVSDVPSRGLREEIEQASKTRSSIDIWICYACIAETLGALVAVPFTAGFSLFILLAVPPTAALGACASNTRRTAAMTKVHLQILAEVHD